MGRPPVPNEVKARRGTLRPDRVPEPQAYLPALADIPPAPRGLSPKARQLWVDIWEGARSWATQGLDNALVESTCRVYDEIAQLRRVLAQRGPLLEEVIVSPKGDVVGTKLVANPAAKMLRDAEKQWTAYLVLLAIPPTERARLGLVQVKAQSKLEALIAARNNGNKVGASGRSALPAADRNSGT